MYKIAFAEDLLLLLNASFPQNESKSNMLFAHILQFFFINEKQQECVQINPEATPLDFQNVAHKYRQVTYIDLHQHCISLGC